MSNSKAPVQQSDDILGGTLVFAGTRVPVHTLIDYLAAGDTIDEFLDDFPSVSREQVIQVLETTEQVLLVDTHARSD
jgi:uncharacterized protein (DUF433 family)